MNYKSKGYDKCWGAEIVIDSGIDDGRYTAYYKDDDDRYKVLEIINEIAADAQRRSQDYMNELNKLKTEHAELKIENMANERFIKQLQKQLTTLLEERDKGWPALTLKNNKASKRRSRLVLPM